MSAGAHQPVRSITVDAVGVPGARTFYLQVQTESGEVLTFLLEKTQALLLSEQMSGLFDAVSEQYPELPSVEPGSPPALFEPESVRFRAGKFALKYEASTDQLEFEVREMVGEGIPAGARFWITRQQARTLGEHARRVAKQGLG